MAYRINMLWDQEAQVWIATSEDVPGLVLENESFDALIEKVRSAVPELVRLNGGAPSEYRLQYSAVRSDLVPAYG